MFLEVLPFVRWPTQEHLDAKRI